MLIGILFKLYLLAKRTLIFSDEIFYSGYILGLVRIHALPAIAWNPGVTVLNTGLYFFTRQDPFALDSVSRIVALITGVVGLFLVMVITRYLTNRWAGLLAGVLLLGSAPWWESNMLSPDYYYSVCVLLLLGLFLIAHLRPLPHWSWAALSLVAFGSVTIRNDGLIVFAVLTLVFLGLCWRQAGSWVARLWLFARQWLLPTVPTLTVLAIFYAGAGYYIVENASVPDRGPNLASLRTRTYLAFEQGEGWVNRFALEAENKTWWGDGHLLARERFGLPAENDHNVVRAILRNPGAWLQRIPLNLRDFLLAWQQAYKGYGLPLLLAAVWGGLALWRERRPVVLFILLLLLPTLSYFLVTFWSSRYIVTLAPLFTILATVGIVRLRSSGSATR